CWEESRIWRPRPWLETPRQWPRAFAELYFQPARCGPSAEAADLSTAPTRADWPWRAHQDPLRPCETGRPYRRGGAHSRGPWRRTSAERIGQRWRRRACQL